MTDIQGKQGQLGSKESNNSGMSEKEIHNQPTSPVNAGPSNFPIDKFVSEDVPLYGKYANNRQARGGMQNKRQQRNATNFGKRKRIDNSSGHMKFEGRDYSLLEYTDYVQAQLDVESHFNKKFSFEKPPDDGCGAWILPAAESMFTQRIWLDDDLQAAKTHLNEVKGQLSYKNIADWHAHTKNTNPAENIAYEIRRRSSPEMVTQAWLKFYEIVNNYEVIPVEEDFVTSSEEEKENKCEEKPFRSVHLCEAPGAFIVALSHYLVVHRPQLQWQWLASTINPYYEGSPSDICVVDDKLINHTMHNWTFGENNTGDLMEKENMEDLVNQANYMGPIHLVTADGSIDCQADPGEQEKDTHNLHLCEVVAALSILAVEGSFIIKKFTMFESETVNLMYLLCCVFKEVHVFKPGTSKEGNSEVYVVCLKYLGKDVCFDHLQKLLDHYGKSDVDFSMFDVSDLPLDFVLQLKNCMELFKFHQIKTITKNISLYGKITEKEEQYLKLLKFKACQMFMEKNYCVRISKEQLLTHNKVGKGRYLLETDLSKPVTSCFVRAKDSIEKLSYAKCYINEYIEGFATKNWIIEITHGEEYVKSKFPVVDLEEVDFDVIRGKPYTRIKASKFCSQKVLECFRVLYKLWENLDSMPNLSMDESLLQLVAKEHPDAEVLKSNITYDPTPDLGAMLEVLCLIREKRVVVNGSFILFNVTLLSRLQCGLLCLLSGAFQNVVIYTSHKFGNRTPVILLENFISMDHGEKLLGVLGRTGWNPFDEEKACSAKVLQIVSYPQLLENVRLCSIFYYNLHHCLHRSLRLLSCLEGILK